MIEKTKAELTEELEQKEKEITRLRSAKSGTDAQSAGTMENKYQTLIENLPQKIFHKDENLVYVSCNENFARELGITPEEFPGHTDFDFFPRELAEKYRADDKEIMASGETREIEESYVRDGKEYFVHTVKTPVRDQEGTVTGILGIFWDITERVQIENELRRHREHLQELVRERTAELEQTNECLQREIAEGKRREEIIKRQAEEIIELSTPVLQVWENVLVAPLIGTLDSERARQFMSRLLEKIADTDSEVALVDITGVPTVDTQTAQNLVETITAVRLLGAHFVLTGVRPAIAQTLVHLGIDLSDIRTCPSLAAGLQMAIEMLEEGSTYQDKNTRGRTI